MVNPVMDQERVGFIRARIGSSNNRFARLSAWPRSHKELPLIELEVDWVRFSTLNHRTKAEQIREQNKTKNRNLFTSDPLGPAAQNAQFSILKSQEGFNDLKDDLKLRRQQEPAVVTAEGVLINGNRRAAALKSLYSEDDVLDANYIRCIVLPEDATPYEITDLETELQIARDFWEEYSWINEAMLIEELYEREGRDFERVAKKMHRVTSDIRSKFEKIQQVNQLVALSGGAYLHIDFEPHNSAFEELAKHIRNKPREEAESVRSAYFLGILSGVKYRELRHLRMPQASSLIKNEIESDPALAPLLKKVGDEGGSDSTTDDLLDDFLGKNEEGDITGILSLLASKTRGQEIELRGGEKVSVADVYQSLQGAIQAAAYEAHEGQRDHESIVAPIERLISAIKEVERAKGALQRARHFSGWVEERFEEKVIALKAAVKSLESAE